MIRGTTPTNTFDVNVDLREAVAIYVTYSQSGVVMFEKTIEDVTVTRNSLSVKLTQEETLSLRPKDVKVQIRAKFADGTAIASKPILATVEQVLKEGVI